MAIVTILAIETNMVIVTILAIETDMAIVTVLAIEIGYQIQGTRSRVDFLAPVTKTEFVETATSLLRRPS